MAEYISREAAIAAAFSATSIGNSAFRDVYDTVNRLRLIPAADVQPVVRCKDCVHWGKHDDVDVPGETERVKGCEWAFWMIGDNGYCSYGERKGGDE